MAPRRAAQFVLGIAGKFLHTVTTRFATINGQPGIIATQDGSLYSVTVQEIIGDHVVGMRIIRNPDKLRHIAAE